MTGHQLSFRAADLAASAFVALLSSVWLVGSLKLGGVGGIFPRDVAIFALVVSAMDLFATWRRTLDPHPGAEIADDLASNELAAMLWPALLVLLIWLVGFLIAIPVFMAAFMISRHNVTVRAGAASIVSLTLAIYLLFVVLLGARLHTGILLLP